MFTQKEIRLIPSGRATYWKSVLQGEGEGYLSALFIFQENEDTQSSRLIGRHAYFLKEKVNKILRRILNAKTAMVFMMKLKQYEEMFSKLRTEQSTQQSSVPEFAEF